MLFHTEYTEEALTCKQIHLNQPPLYAQTKKVHKSISITMENFLKRKRRGGGGGGEGGADAINNLYGSFHMQL